MFSLEWIPWLAVIVGGLIAAITDIRERKVYNLLTYPLFLSGLIFHTAVSGGWGFATSLGGALFGFLILLAPCFLGGIGAGDVKLLAAIGAWLRVPIIIHVFILAGLAIGLWSIVVILKQGMSFGALRERIEAMVFRLMLLHEYVANGQTVAKPEGNRQPLIPFAVFVAMAVVVYAGLWFGNQLPTWIRSAT
jgi:prepilin peptidase CpaA